ncbi:unnamed protein product [Parnassius apollo]|uniref:(apollo) hypothetical protein n=1 Tax=Parnassius apollo TaxID=110799 RepID=A0A8S3VYV9_PARAO|nr:unnamed protein product [Parnassius apollo]
MQVVLVVCRVVAKPSRLLRRGKFDCGGSFQYSETVLQSEEREEDVLAGSHRTQTPSHRHQHYTINLRERVQGCSMHLLLRHLPAGDGYYQPRDLG